MLTELVRKSLIKNRSIEKSRDDLSDFNKGQASGPDAQEYTYYPSFAT